MPNYTPQVWADSDVSKPLSAARMNYIEAGILAAPVEHKAPSIVQPGWDSIFLGGISSAAVTTALKPTFCPIKSTGCPFILTQLGIRVGTGVAASLCGVAIYTIVYSGASTFTATLVAQLNATLDSSATGVLQGDCTTGAAGSGASTYTFDFTNNMYIIGSMASTVTTLAIQGTAPPSHLGALSYTAAARASVTDWPASFTNTSVGATGGTARINCTYIFNADGKLWF